VSTDFRSGEARHHEVEQDDIRATPVEFGDPGRAVVCLDDLEAFFGEHVRQGFAVGLLVLDDKHPSHWLISWASYVG
jgi:hypothetical protein